MPTISSTKKRPAPQASESAFSRKTVPTDSLYRLAGIALGAALAAFAVCSIYSALSLARHPETTSFPWWSAFPLTFLRMLPLLLVFGGARLILALLTRRKR